MRRTSLEDAECPVARSLDAIGDWWSLLIVRDALDGLRRFGEFQKNLGLAKNILATRLRTLVAEDILELAPASDGSAYQEYVLTDKGRSLYLVIAALRQWGEAHSLYDGPTDSVMVDKKKRRPVRRLELRAEDGRVLGPGETVIEKVPARPKRRATPAT